LSLRDDASAATAIDGALISVIMPVRNERATIEAAIDSVLAQRVDRPLELVIADGLSDDGTREYLERRAAADPRVRVVDNPARTTPTGLNAALDAARGRYTVRVDGHSVAPLDFVQRLVRHLDEGRCEGAGGIVRAVGRSPFGRAVALAHGSRFGIGNAKHHYADTPQFIDHIAHGAYFTDRLRAIGGFDPEFVRNQDYELDHRYRLAGGRLLLDPDVVFDWWVRDAPRALARQYFQYGYWRFRSLERHPDSFSVRWMVPPALVVVLAAGLVASPSRAGRRLLVATGTAYGLALSLGVAGLRRAPDRPAVARLPLAFATMHLAWGAGFLASAARSITARSASGRLRAGRRAAES
jgi:GT2 family glycosyltransferase